MEEKTKLVIVLRGVLKKDDEKRLSEWFNTVISVVHYVYISAFWKEETENFVRDVKCTEIHISLSTETDTAFLKLFEKETGGTLIKTDNAYEIPTYLFAI